MKKAATKKNDRLKKINRKDLERRSLKRQKPLNQKKVAVEDVDAVQPVWNPAALYF